MAKIAIILILLLLYSYVVTLLGDDLSGWWSTIVRIMKVSFVYLGGIAILYARRSYVPKQFSAYICFTFVIFLICLYHYMLLPAGFESQFQQKNLITIGGFLLVMLIVLLTVFSKKDILLLTYFIGGTGIVLGGIAIFHSLFGKSVQDIMYVGPFLRAGSDATGALMLSAILNLTTVLSIASYLLTTRYSLKVLFLVSVLVSQAGRFLTFSTAGFFSILLSVLVAYILLRKKSENKTLRKTLLRLMLAFIVIFAILVVFFDLEKIIFYRLLLSDELIVRQSITSRFDQYFHLLSLIYEEPLRLVLGYGDDGYLAVSNARIFIHNVFLNMFATYGIFAMFSFVGLYWLSFKHLRETINSADRELAVLGIFYMAAFFGWFVHALTYPGDKSVVQWVFFILPICFIKVKLKDCRTESAILSGTVRN